ncbi:MAG: nodulation protein NfeD [FCB group bacterium]|nr:nodulation protein NfeD [FCB group bacterium]
MSPQRFYKWLWVFVLLNVAGSCSFASEGIGSPFLLSPSQSIVVQDSAALSAKTTGTINVITVSGVINPVSAEFILKSIERAEAEKAQSLVIKIDTPGGLMEAMRDIVKGIMGADVPVIVYVAPGGARAASAGVFITMAAHIAIMAPGTNIGAAHPLMMGAVPGMPNDTSGTLMDKVTNDAIAYLQSIAEKRGRNVEWAKEAVLNSKSITAREALTLGVIDTLAEGLPEVLQYIDGKEVEVSSGPVVIASRGAAVQIIEKGLRYRVLDRISDPNIAYILLLLGIYGIFFELSNPGAIFPGVLGAISLVLAFFSFQMLPVNYAGLALMAISIILFILEIKITSYGLLSIGGVVTLLLGSLMLFESPDPLMRVSWKVIIPTVVFTALFFLFAVGFAIKAQRKPTITGAAGMVGLIGRCVTDIDPKGQVLVQGEIWQAVSDRKIPSGTSVKVKSINGMVLFVEAVD